MQLKAGSKRVQKTTQTLQDKCYALICAEVGRFLPLGDFS